jgi:hypothetical protein
MLVGSLYWRTLRWTATMLASGHSIALAIAAHLVRFAGLGAFLVVVAIHWGALPLLLSAGGLMLARAVVLRLDGRR